MRRVLLLLLVLWPGAALAQWGPVHEGDEEAPALPPRVQEAAGPSAVERLRLVPALVGGYWGLASPSGQWFEGVAGLGARLSVEPVAWLPLELWVLHGGRGGGTPVVASETGYNTAAFFGGYQHVRGSLVYALSVGLALTYVSVRHRVELGDGQDVSAGGLRLGPAWSFSLKWRLGLVEARVDLGSVWRAGQADVLATLGFGVVLPAWGD